MHEQVRAALRYVAGHGLPGSLTEPPTVPLPADQWDELLRAVDRERLNGLLWAAVRDGTLPVTEDQSAQAADGHIAAMGAALRLEQMLVSIVRELNGAGIEARVLKGSAVAHLNYPNPALRPFGDIDLLVQGDDFDTAAATVERMGFVREFTEPRPGFNRQFGKGASFRNENGVEIDLHRTFVLGPYGLRVDLEQLWAGRQPFTVCGEQLWALDDNERFLNACYSAAISDAKPRLINLRDVAQMILHGRVDRRQARVLARAWNAEAPVVRAVNEAWRELNLADVTALSAWARRYQTQPHEERDLALYTTPGVSYTAQSLAAIGAIPGSVAKARFVYALGRPKPEYLEGVQRSFARRLWRGSQDLARARRNDPTPQ